MLTNHIEDPGDRTAMRERLTAPNKSRYSFFSLLQIAVAVGLVAFLVSRIGLHAIAQSFSGADPGWLALRIAIGFVLLFLRSVRWNILLRVQGICVPTFVLFKRSWMASFASNFSPGKSGGDLFRVFAPWQQPLKKTPVGTSVLYDRLTGFVGLVVALALVALVEHGLAEELNLGLLPIFCIPAAAILLSMLTMREPVTWARWLTARCPVEKARSIAEGILTSAATYTDRKLIICSAVGISVALHLVTAISSYLMFLALGVDISFGSVLFIYILISVITLVPITFNGWGIREGVFVLLYTQVGVGAAQALSVALLGRLISLFMASTGAIFYLYHRPKK